MNIYSEYQFDQKETATGQDPEDRIREPGEIFLDVDPAGRVSHPRQWRPSLSA